MAEWRREVAKLQGLSHSRNVNCGRAGYETCRAGCQSALAQVRQATAPAIGARQIAPKFRALICTGSRCIFLVDTKFSDLKGGRHD